MSCSTAIHANNMAAELLCGREEGFYVTRKQGMASANTTLSEEQFLCSICLDVFTDPVSTPCGHNYCKTCITNYWALGPVIQCPLCQEKFPVAPKLRVNTSLRDLLEVFQRSRYAQTCDAGRSPVRPGEVPCDLCSGMKNKARKSCLVCLASYCDAHLEPHGTVQALQWHTLINPVVTLEDRVCKKHNKLMELFCSEDQSCVCIMCLRDGHVNHKAVSLEEEFQERKTKLKHMKRQVKSTLTEKCNMADKIQKSVLRGRQEVERTKAETNKAFAALVASIESRKLELLRLLEEKQRAAELKAEALIGQLQLEIAENHRRNEELKNLLETEDEFKLLQDLPSVSSPSNSRHLCAGRVQLHVEAVKSAVAKMVETLHHQMDRVTAEVNLVYEEEEVMHTQTEHIFDDPLGIIQGQCAVNVTLDADSAHPCLMVSGDGKRVRDVGMKRRVPDNSARFDTLHYVTGKEGFSSGRFYFEVCCKDQTGWEVGVAREPINKRGVGLLLSPDHGCWTLGLYWGRYQANANPPVALNLSKKPQKVGVFVDYERGLVSFYDVDARALIYSFTGCAFTVSLPSVSKLAHWIFTSIPEKTRIYPLLRPGGDLQITPLH